MKDIDWNHPKYAANPLLMGMMWQAAMMKTIMEGCVEKHFPQMAAMMKQMKGEV